MPGHRQLGTVPRLCSLSFCMYQSFSGVHQCWTGVIVKTVEIWRSLAQYRVWIPRWYSSRSEVPQLQASPIPPCLQGMSPWHLEWGDPIGCLPPPVSPSHQHHRPVSSPQQSSTIHTEQHQVTGPPPSPYLQPTLPAALSCLCGDCEPSNLRSQPSSSHSK